VNLYRFSHCFTKTRIISQLSLLAIIFVVSCKGVADNTKDSPVVLTSENGDNQVYVKHKKVDAELYCQPISGQTYKIGDNLDIGFTLPGKSLTVSNGTPSINFSLDSGTAAANYYTGSGTSALVFRYTIVEGDSEDNLQPPDEFEKNGASILYPENKEIKDGIFCEDGYTNIVIDGIRPEVTQIIPVTTGTLNTGDTLSLDFVFNETVTIEGLPVSDVQLTFDSGTVNASFASQPAGNRLRYSYIINPSDVDSNGISVASNFNINGATLTDTAGNSGSTDLPSVDTSEIFLNVAAALSFAAQTTNDYGVVAVSNNSSLLFDISNNHVSTNATSLSISLDTGYGFTGGSFPGTSGDCTGTLNASSSCTIDISFSPTIDGPQNGLIALDYFNGYQNDESDFSLLGEGLTPPASANLSSPTNPLSNIVSPLIEIHGVRVGATVEIYRNATCTILNDTTAPAPTSSISANLTALPEGGNTLYLTQTYSGTQSACSSGLLTYTVDTTAPSNPTALVLSGGATTNQSELISWTAATDANGISHYLYGIGTVSGTDNHLSYQNISNVLEYRDSTISYAGVNYWTTIKAVDNAGNISSGAISSSWTLDITPPAPPSALTMTSDFFNGNLPTSINGFSWTHSGVDLDHIKVALGSTPGGNEIKDWTTADTNSTHIFPSVVGVSECLSIYPVVKSVDAANNESSGIHYDSIKWDNTSPSDPTVMVVTNSEAYPTSSISVSWTAATDSCSSVEYQASLSTTPGGNDTNDWIGIGSGTSYQMQDGVDGASFTLIGSTDYYINIRAIDSAGNISSGILSSSAFKTKPPFALLKGNETMAGGSPTNLAQTSAFEMKWHSSSFTSGYFDHNPAVNEHQLTIKTAGSFLLTLTFPVSGTGQRAGINTDVLLNGSLLDVTFSSSSYLRNNSNHDNSSNHLSVVLSNLLVDDIITIRTVRASAVTSNVTLDGDAALYMEYLDPARSIFEATSNSTTTGTNLNVVSPTKFIFNHNGISGDFSHDNGMDPEDIIINTDAHYLVTFNVPTQTACGSNRHAVKIKMQKNGSDITGAMATQGYTRCSNAFNHATLHFSAIIELNATDVITISAERDTNQTSNITLYPGTKASLYMEKLDPEKFLSLSGTETTNSTNWNAVASAEVKWDNEYFKDGGIFSHSTSTNSHQITVLEDGDYMIVYNDALSSSVVRANVSIKVKVNGTVIDYASCKSHYIRSDNDHNDSSCSIHTMLENLNVNDVISIEAGQEAVAGVVNISGEAKIGLIKK
ncbi:hypothetical protein N9N67_10880, partial [Bacteriovoracaceae bacterium]|nr:hypothetical protein [Bacteriovoracaceae bacterium]